jgi:benzoate membrane transport protein
VAALPDAYEADYTAMVLSLRDYMCKTGFKKAVLGLSGGVDSALVAAIAGLALLGTIGGAMHNALQHEAHREAALITFLVTLSGVVIAGVGSAFWGIVAGALALLVQHVGRAPRTGA